MSGLTEGVLAALAALIGAVAGTIGTLATYKLQLRKTKSEETVSLIKARSEEAENQADTAVRIGEAWGALLLPLENRVKTLEEDNRTLREKVRELESENRKKDELIAELERELETFRKRFGRRKANEEV